MRPLGLAAYMSNGPGFFFFFLNINLFVTNLIYLPLEILIAVKSNRWKTRLEILQAALVVGVLSP